MSQDERCIVIEYVHLCGDHAMEWKLSEFRTPEFDAWMEQARPPETMRDRLVRREEVTSQLVGCAYCWSSNIDRNNLATFSIELTIDGDA